MSNNYDEPTFLDYLRHEWPFLMAFLTLGCALGFMLSNYQLASAAFRITDAMQQTGIVCGEWERAPMDNARLTF